MDQLPFQPNPPSAVPAPTAAAAATTETTATKPTPAPAAAEPKQSKEGSPPAAAAAAVKKEEAAAAPASPSNDGELIELSVDFWDIWHLGMHTRIVTFLVRVYAQGLGSCNWGYLPNQLTLICLSV